jgi:hypothetical protein
VGRLRLALLLVALVATACGPSFQAVYECDVHFEHCYALEETAVSTALKRQCWQDWLKGYTYGQSRDRIEYASKRDAALSSDPLLSSVAPNPSSDPVVAHAGGPAPTNAFAPPPNVASAEVSGSVPVTPDAGSANSAVASRVPPGTRCGDACVKTWSACSEECEGGVSCAPCDLAYRTCMPACFH